MSNDADWQHNYDSKVIATIGKGKERHGSQYYPISYNQMNR